MAKEVFVLGLLDWQRSELETIDHAEEMNFHSLLSYEEVVEENSSFDVLLDKCRAQLQSFHGKPDAIVCHWDFPSSCLAPIIAAEHGIPAPPLDAVLKCEHKYWARIEQRKVVPDCVPEFQALDPFAPDAADQLRLSYPVWVKPVKGFSSLLGFRVENRADLEDALSEFREHIGELGVPFDECLRHADLPAEVKGVGGQHALAEGIMSGWQFALEGYVLNGEVHIHGTFDMLLDQGGKSVVGLGYPADLASELEERSTEICRKVLEQVGFDNGCFNGEFLWDEAERKLWLIEVNTRISQSHCELFRMVNGMSNHEIAVSVSLGTRPHLPAPDPNRTAAKFVLTKLDDAVVTKCPPKEELERIGEEFGDVLIEMVVEEGDTLSELRGQPVYCFNVAEVWIAANSRAELMEKRARIAEKLPVEFSDGRGLMI